MNVYEALLSRLDVIFKEFDNVYVSFSGGKDSGVLLNAAVSFVREHYPGRKIGLFHIDYEAQYQMTTDYVDSEITKHSDVLDVYHICLPIKAQCCTSMFQDHWIPWEQSKKDIWVREMPNKSLNEFNCSLDFFRHGMWDYELQKQFSSWYHQKNKAKRTACLVGIRTQESLNRWRAIHSDRNYKKFESYKWTKEINEGVYNCYPIFDWITEDIWLANLRNGWQYNKVYDLFYMAGVPLNAMRVASPFNDAAQSSLKLYKAIDPNNWAKMIGRVNGVNFTAIYGGTTAMGWNSIKLPEGHTWESYMHFLLSTLPEEAKRNYLEKLSTSIKFWREKGGCLSEDTIDKLKASGVKIELGINKSYKTSKIPVRMEYIDEIDISEAQEIPTFKRMCITIMKNDHHCKYMGFSPSASEIARRKEIIEKYKSLL